MSLFLERIRVPTLEAGRRYQQARLECWANTPHPALDGQCPWDVARTAEGPARLRDLFNDSRMSSEVRAMQAQTLLPLPDPSRPLTEALERSGGLLNIFLAPPTREDLERLGPSARETSWNTAPCVLLSGLTPAEVVVGGGPKEMELIHEAMTGLAESLSQHGDSWPSRGEACMAFLLQLRQWQVVPQAELGARTPMAVIFEERSALVAQRLGPEYTLRRRDA